MQCAIMHQPSQHHLLIVISIISSHAARYMRLFSVALPPLQRTRYMPVRPALVGDTCSTSDVRLYSYS